MDHIFGDSHDISFGATSPQPKEKPQREPAHKPQQQTHTRPQAPRANRPSFREDNFPRSKREAGVSQDSIGGSVLPSLGDVPPLTRLVTSMKSSFFPKEEDTTAVRAVILSPSVQRDPLMLVMRDDETVLIGSGFDSIVRAGKTYSTFPDMRLVFSEKEHLSAWILTDEEIDVLPFLSILPSLGFPPIYASRSIIAKFRNTLVDTAFLEKCRFFELFAGGSSDRRIGSFEFLVASHEGGSCLMLRSSTTQIGFEHISVAGVTNSILSKEQIMKKNIDTFSFGAESFSMGEILTFRGKTVSKHSLKFTFDTFYLDAQSVGIVAGYTLPDREALATNGVLIFTLEEDMRARTIAGHIFIDSRGFVHAYEMMAVHKEILKGIRATYEKLILENERIERGELVQSLRREITKYCYVLTGRTPVVMPIVIER